MKLYPLSQLLYHENDSLLLERVQSTAPSRGTVHETPSATSYPRGEEGAFQRPVVATGVIIPHLPSASSPLPVTVLACPTPSLLSMPPPPFMYQGVTSHPLPSSSLLQGSASPTHPHGGRKKLPPWRAHGAGG